MNYSTIKKVVACSMIAALGVTSASAQDGTTSSSAKVFGGRAQYRTWSLGVNAGVLMPVAVTGGSDDFANWDVKLGYGLTLRKQLGHAFGLELAGLRGDLSGSNSSATDIAATDRRSFETELGWAGSLSGVVNVATVDFLRRENSVNFIVKAGYGFAGYAPKTVNAANVALDWKGKAGSSGDKDYVIGAFIPVGVGVKFKLSNRVNFDLGYNMYFVDADNLDGTYAKGTSKDKFSYGYGGLEFSLGKSSKPNLDWVNPVAMMYDELKDNTLRQEVEALKGRVSTLENTVNQLAADADGDGVSDKFDKCPGTPAGTVVDGSGCPIKFPEPAATTTSSGNYSNIQFEFDSSVLKTSSYPTLDQVSADLRADNTKTITLSGYASAEGTEAYNLKLSKDRANSVKTYLVNSGVDAKRITIKAFGESNPIADNSTEEGRILNRRVEFK
ncbi:OmpA family protein (plasmid) [Pedobacter sp. BS3]|uniref:OmpA family protein n=1 Tax=Pedobacter sp. BS3 TaxID=2567937 RepID=UPI0011EE97FF|nr:OmpA family protein [Pedobacter sp. BS3]TZF86112.1 OmpA family protein [Pedobacter sp. BS3]